MKIAFPGSFEVATVMQEKKKWAMTRKKHNIGGTFELQAKLTSKLKEMDNMPFFRTKSDWGKSKADWARQREEKMTRKRRHSE